MKQSTFVSLVDYEDLHTNRDLMWRSAIDELRFLLVQSEAPQMNVSHTSVRYYKYRSYVIKSREKDLSPSTRKATQRSSDIIV